MRPRASRLWFFLLLSVAGVVACGGNGTVTPPGTSSLRPGGKQSTPIQHVIIVIQENRSFDNLFATFPNANGTTVGQVEAMPPSLATACPSPITQATTIPLTEHNLIFGDDFQHDHSAYLTDYDNGNMDGFDLENKSPGGTYEPSCTYNYAYVNPSQIQPYWQLAQQYVLADNTFQTQGSGSFTAHQDLIAGGTVVNYSTGSCSGSTCLNSIIDDPTGFPWGCDARTPDPYASPPIEGAVTSLITTQLQYLLDRGPFPCLSYATMRDLLDAKAVSWKFYAPPIQGWTSCHDKGGDTAGIWSAFDAISAVRYGKEWGTKVPGNNLRFFSDIKDGTLPAVSWITPDALDSDHPQEEKHGPCGTGGPDEDYGPSWVAQIVNAVGQSKYWKSTAVVILWDDWGGFYDHVKPPFQDNQGGLGFRIPMLIVSPYVQPHVEHTQYEDASILRFIEDNWNLGSLGTTDVRATPITNAFDFNQTPRPFQTIAASKSKAFFLHQKPSGIPADTQ